MNMKTEDDELRKMLKKSLEPLHGSVPDFDLMWKTAAETSKQKKQMVWTAAAGIAFLAIVGVGLLVTQTDIESQNGAMQQIETWQEPTQSLMTRQNVSEPSDIAGWTSPTEHLLQITHENIK
jgi:hypothetical protein